MPFSHKNTKHTLLALFGFVFSFLLLAALPIQAMATATTSTPDTAVQDVVAQLGTLQRAHIDPAWPPDVEANQALVQALLTSFTALTPAQRSQLTSSQNDDLLAYFSALYRAQGKSASAAAALFEGDGRSQGSSSSSSSHSASGSSSSSKPVSSQNTSASGVRASSANPSSSLPSAFSAPAATASSSPSVFSGLPTAAFPPQVPGSGGPFSFLGSAAFGQLLTVLLVALLAFLVLRFLFAMRAAGPAPDTRRAQRTQRKNQPQQNEDAALLAALPHTEALHPDFQLSEALTPAERRTQKRRLRAQKKQKHPSTTAAHLTTPLSPESPLVETGWASHKPINPAEMDAIAEMFTAPTPQDIHKNPLGIVLSPESLPKNKGARTGKPGRIRFSQGDPRDLDAIDD